MVHPSPPTRSRRRPAAYGSDRGVGGFTTFELIAVLIVMAALMAIAVPMFLKARQRTIDRTVVTAAFSYKTAIDSYRLDRAGKVPPNTSTPGEWAAPADGPLDPTGSSYLHGGIPDVVLEGLVPIDGVTSGKWAFTYEARTGNGQSDPMAYTLMVWKDGSRYCQLTDGAPDPAHPNVNVCAD